MASRRFKTSEWFTLDHQWHQMCQKGIATSLPTNVKSPESLKMPLGEGSARLTLRRPEAEIQFAFRVNRL